MARLKLPFELEKPSSNEYVTQASEVGMDGQSVEQRITGIKNTAVSEASDAGNILSVCDGNGKIIAKLNEGVEVDSDGNVITKSFNSSEVLSEEEICDKIDKKIAEAQAEGDLEVSSENNFAFSVSDGEDAVLGLKSGLLVDTGGVIKTVSFDSSEMLTEEEINDKIDKKISEAQTDSAIDSKEEPTYAFSVSDGEDIVLGMSSGMRTDEEGNIKTKGFQSNLLIKSARSIFPKLDVHKEEFKWLDIGNSHSLCSLGYLKNVAISQGVDLSKVAFVRVNRGGSSFKSWVQAWHDEDTSGTGDQLTGGKYQLLKDFGGLSVKVTGNTYTEVAGTPTPVTNAEVTNNIMVFWGGDCSILRSLLKDNKFDLITIHQRYISHFSYEESDGFRDHSDNGYLSEFIRIVKTYQPQACVGYLFALLPWEFSGSSLNGVRNYYKQFSTSVRKVLADTGIDIIFPCETALENLRASSVPNATMEGTGLAGSITLRNGFNYDSAHTTFGAVSYTMACVAWEAIFAQRYGKSCLGNTYRELIEDDGGSGAVDIAGGRKRKEKRLRGSYIDSNNSKQLMTWYDQYLYCYRYSDDGGTTWGDWDYSDIRTRATIRVSDDNAVTCQMAAILAVNDMWNINNPDGIII